tara:strand:+ start:896 stop:1108 length:213 start_codon:yes stop_codon:yes gene_type:complete
MDFYLDNILQHAAHYAQRRKSQQIQPRDLSQAMQHQGGGVLNLDGDVHFCGGELSQCYEASILKFIEVNM